MSQFENMQAVERRIEGDLSQNPDASDADVRAMADKAYDPISTTNPKSPYNKNFFVWVFLGIGVVTLIVAAVLGYFEYQAVRNSIQVDATIAASPMPTNQDCNLLGHCDYAYELTYDAYGQTYSATLTFVKQTWQQGDTLAILVDKRHPTSPVLADQYHYIATTIAGGLALLWLLMVPLYYWVLTPWADRYSRRFYEKQALKAKARRDAARAG